MAKRLYFAALLGLTVIYAGLVGLVAAPFWVVHEASGYALRWLCRRLPEGPDLWPPIE